MRKVAGLMALLATGCASMEPVYVRPDSAIPVSWPQGDAYLRQTEAELPAVTYRDIFTDPRLQTLIGQALVNNRDLLIAAANIAAAREQVRIQRAQQLPQVDASAGASGTGDSNDVSTRFDVGVGVSGFELDLFGRLRSLTDVQRNRYFATESAARATRLSLVSDIASAWLTYSADASLLKIAEDTVASAEKSVRLTRARLEGGIAPRTDLRQAQQILEAAKADAADQRTALAQDVNLLRLLVGAEIDPSLLPASIDQVAPTVKDLPAGLDSTILLRRPDVVEAEYQLRAANAQIGAARAALFPRITLTGLLGLASTSIAGLFSGGAFQWSPAGNATYSIFQGGAGRANVRLTEAQKAAAVATYQQAIQRAFREVSDALARRGTIDEQLRARQAQREAAADTYLLTEARYRNGIDSFLNSLDAQRSFYSAQRTLVLSRLEATSNLVELYRSLGGDSSLG
ncbi:efflux transporter outer membrane subunit [Sphingomonas daechungensis]|uniref:efflux transporter outer membrane subunit n=1 Tax=Sphingomonas daechungensis TaxID=1176646 RepID=UPI0037837BC9